MPRKMPEIYLAECYQRPESDASHGFAFSRKSCDRCDQDPPAGCREEGKRRPAAKPPPKSSTGITHRSRPRKHHDYPTIPKKGGNSSLTFKSQHYLCLSLVFTSHLFENSLKEKEGEHDDV